MEKSVQKKPWPSSQHIDIYIIYNIYMSRLQRPWFGQEKLLYPKNKIAIISAMTNMYFLARNNMPNCLIPKLHELCIDQVIIIVNF